jgi:mitochondrial fission protein ELM1
MIVVAVIGCAPSDILSACHITIASLAKEGHRIYAIVAPSGESESSSSLPENTNVQQLAVIGITQTFLLDRFDYSAITQSNADAINSYIKSVKPSVVIMPSWKSPNHLRKILARTSLIACRGVGTILMYELDANNTGFNPNITFEGSAELSLKQQLHTNILTEKATTAIPAQDEIHDIKTFTNNSMLHDKGFKASSYQRLEEKFESHRTLLLEEEEGLFDSRIFVSDRNHKNRGRLQYQTQ